MRKAELTQPERSVLNYIIQFKTVNGFSPTIREIMTGTNYSSTNYISDILYRLQEKGYITFRERQSRTIVIRKFPTGA